MSGSTSWYGLYRYRVYLLRMPKSKYQSSFLFNDRENSVQLWQKERSPCHPSPPAQPSHQLYNVRTTDFRLLIVVYNYESYGFLYRRQLVFGVFLRQLSWLVFFDQVGDHFFRIESREQDTRIFWMMQLSSH